MQRGYRRRGSAVALAVAAGLVALSGAAGGPVASAHRARAASPGPSPGLVRVNQVGYLPSEPKLAFVLTRRPEPRTAFRVLRAGGGTALSGFTGGGCPRWSARWAGCRTVAFTALRRAGTYRIRVGGAYSPPFRIAPAGRLYGPLAAGAVGFLQAQRDGSQVIPGPLHRQAAHLSDARASVYATPRYRDGLLASPLRRTPATVDLSGGWFDAGDYLKFSGTASFTDVLLLFTLREYGTHLPGEAALAREARFGTDWLLRTWDERRRVLFEQVGLGDGNNGSILGDHDLWRLPQADDHLRDPTLRYLAHRPAFAANRAGDPVSPNLAGREAAAFALCAQVFAASDPAYADRCLTAAQTLYDSAARRWRGPLAGSVPASYYAEQEWRDDMELAATELYLATRAVRAPGVPHPDAGFYLKPASAWADSYMSAAIAGEDALNLYDVAALAHYDLYRVMVATGHTTDLWTNASDVLGDLHDQLSLAASLSRGGPLGLADPATPDDTVAHALGYAAEARLYDALVGRGSYDRLAERQLGWVLGANPWGSSFVVGAGSLFPHCLAHQVANLSGSLTGRPPILTGAVVDGPAGAGEIRGLGAPDGFRRCAAHAGTFAGLDGRGFAYRDDVRSFATSEPADDLAALSLLAFAQEASPQRRASLTLPG